LRGQKWQSVEHYYQAQKFRGTELEQTIQNIPTPEEAKKHAELNTITCPSWDVVKTDIMFEGQMAMFEQNLEAREKLLKSNISMLTGEFASVLPTVKAILQRENEEKETIVISPDGTEANVPVNQIKKAKNNKKRNERRNVWKDNAGGSLLELDETSNTVSLVGDSSVSFSYNALPSNAKFVVKNYQYEKRRNNRDRVDQSKKI